MNFLKALDFIVLLSLLFENTFVLLEPAKTLIFIQRIYTKFLGHGLKEVIFRGNLLESFGRRFQTFRNTFQRQLASEEREKHRP